MKHILIFVFIGGFSLASLAQTWRSSLYPADWTPPTTKNFYTDAFIQDYSYAGYHLGDIDIPTVTTNIIDVTKPPYNADNSGAINATVLIQNAINSAQTAGGGVVYLPAGIYKVSPQGVNTFCLQISKSNIILRGDGIGKTFLYNEENNMTRKSIINIVGGGNNWEAEGANSTPITSDLMGPTAIIPLRAPIPFKVGDWVIVRNNASDGWSTEHKETEWLGFQSKLDGTMHYRKVLQVDLINNTITIDAPIRYALKTRDNARVYTAPTMNSEIGLEDFSIGNKEVVTNTNEWLEVDVSGNPRPGFLDDDAHKTVTKGAYKCFLSYLISVDGVRDSWIQNVSSYKPAGNIYRTHMLSCGIVLSQCRGVTLDNVYVGFAQYGAGANAYGYRIESNDCLLKNCKAEVTRHGFVFSLFSASGNVIHRCTDLTTGSCTANSTSNVKTQNSCSDFHMHFSPSNLIDQMTLNASAYNATHQLTVGSDPRHNAVSAHSTFWNTNATNSPTGYCIRTSQTRTGYVIGTSGNTSNVNYQLSQGGPAFAWEKTGQRTLPEDIVEGVGKAATLQPQSLYLDQLARRKSLLSSVNDVKDAFKANEVAIYPNPSSDGKFNLSVPTDWKVYSLLGEVVVTGTGNNVNISRYSKGIYIIKTKENVKRVVVK